MTPQRLYRGPIARLLNRRFVLLLTTLGRRSRQPRSTLLTYMPLEGRLVTYAGARGERADWYRNLLANQEAVVRTGSSHFRARAPAGA